MKECIFELSLSTVNEVEAFVEITTQLSEEVDVLSGRYVVNGKSILALFSIDLSSIKVVLHGGQEDAEKFKALAKGKFILSQLQ